MSTVLKKVLKVLENTVLSTKRERRDLVIVVM